MRIAGKVWKLGDSVAATDIVSSRYDKFGMNKQWAECAQHVFEDSKPNFVSAVQQGDILVAGKNFGSGHAHYYMAAIMGCKFAGLTGLLAESVNGLFQRAAIDQGVPALTVAGLSEFVNDQDHLEFDLMTGEAYNQTSRTTRKFVALSPIVIDILTAGGSLNWALHRVGKNYSVSR